MEKVIEEGTGTQHGGKKNKVREVKIKEKGSRTEENREEKKKKEGKRDGQR